MKRKKLMLDLYCCQGGAAMGYHLAGWKVLGVDIKPQPRYPFAFVQCDAVDYVREHGHRFDAIHASPPCQRFSIASKVRPEQGTNHPDLLTTTRAVLEMSGKPYVIENVIGAPMRNWAVMLCGLMFGLKVFRHRNFESNVMLFTQPHLTHKGKRIGEGGMVCVAGHGDTKGGVPKNYRTKAAWAAGMGIDWMTLPGLRQAVPPAYMQYLGAQLLAAI